MLRVLELFCGIGGVAAALDAEPLASRMRIGAAIDVHRGALHVYRHNFPRHHIAARNIESLGSAELATHEADLWWLSPPCQPFTVRGLRRDADDPRARPFLALLERLVEIRPSYVALENVAGFRGSQVHTRLLRALELAGYGTIDEQVLCPSELGVPNRRPRYYLMASRVPSLPMPFSPSEEGGPSSDLPLAAFLDPEPEPGLAIDPGLLRRYASALHVVDAEDPNAVANCFTSAYGRSHVRSGSYLRQKGRVRRFSPREILRILGFPDTYRLPADLPRDKAWRLAGNSLSLFAVRRRLTRIAKGSGANAIGYNSGYGAREAFH